MQTHRARYTALARLALAVAGASSAASAQSAVTLYGIVDVGVQTRNRAADGDRKASEVRSGGLSPSIWGLKGSEDLGSGTKVSFNLEGHFSSNTGGLTNGPGFAPQLFRRQANVGISGTWGSLTLGRQYSPAIISMLGVEPRGYKEQFSGLYVWAYNQLAAPGDPFGAGNNTGNDVGVFIGNAIQYSNSFGPVWLGAAYSIGTGGGFGKNGNQISLGASYAGPVTVGFGYHKLTDTLSGEDVNEAWTLGVAVPFGAFTGKLAYINAENSVPATGAALSTVKSLGAGVDYKWSERNTANFTVYNAKYEGDRNATTRSFVLSNDYALSKRTTLYVQFARADADNYSGGDLLQGLKTTIVADGQLNGKKTSLLGLGIRHSF